MASQSHPGQPLAEVFGFPINNFSDIAEHYRTNRLCPYNNRVPSCTKSRIKDPLGVCSIYTGNTDNNTAIVCPVRFRQDWLITAHAAAFIFPPDTTWTTLSEITLRDANHQVAGNIDIVLVAYDATGTVTDFGSLEVQAVYISGNLHNPFKQYMSNPRANATMEWQQRESYPRPDYLSSSRKRLAPQLILKGGILHAWGKKMAVAVDKGFFAQLPVLQSVPAEQAEIAWLIYDLQYDLTIAQYQLVHVQTVYTLFNTALQTITTSEPGNVADFINTLQTRLDRQLGTLPTAITPYSDDLAAVDLDAEASEDPTEEPG